MATSYRSLVLLCTLLTGATGLLFQTAWQKYLALLVGSESRSAALIVAVFLAGLAAGYRYWGRVTERVRTRAGLLRVYGAVELAIGAYAAVFPFWFPVVQSGASALGDGLWVDALAAIVLLFPPTFLMGATVPLLTSALPEAAADASRLHARIYGLNTLGACAGVVLGAFWVIPALGLNGALALGGAIDAIVGAILLANRARGASLRADPVPQVANRLGTPVILAFAFVSGAVIIAMEMIVLRALTLTLGAGFFVFPIGVGLFVLGLAAGSLRAERVTPSPAALFRAIAFAAAGLACMYATIPLWPTWVNHMRVSLANLPTNYPVYLVLSTLLIGALILPFLSAAGRLLPLAYALLDKSPRDFGKVCGRLYFVNTAGTVAGAVGLGHLALALTNLDGVFRACLALLLASFAALLWKERWRKAAPVAAVLALVALALPGWNRSSHYEGLFRVREAASFHFKGVFSIPSNIPTPLFFKDDPDSTVAVSKNEANLGKGIINNGKPDGNTFSPDYSTMLLTGTLGYLHGPDRRGLRAAVVGLGTGITAGILGQGRDVASVDVIEISKAIIEASREFQDANFGTLSNPKLRHVQADAFRYFARQSRAGARFDLVVSEPSNPWVVGVENLFTPTFYELTKNVLAPDGVFVQWVQLYELDDTGFLSILSNVSASFGSARVFLASRGDALIVASRGPLPASAFERRIGEEVLKKVHARIGVEGRDGLAMLELYGPAEVRWLAASYHGPRHDVQSPRLGFDAAEHFFLGSAVGYERLIGGDIARRVRFHPEKARAFEKLLGVRPAACTSSPERVVSAVCSRLSQYGESLQVVRAMPEEVPANEILAAYRRLREGGFVASDPNFLAAMVDRVSAISAPLSARDKALAVDVLLEMTRDGHIADAREAAARLASGGFFRDETLRQLNGAIERSHQAIESLMARYAELAGIRIASLR